MSEVKQQCRKILRTEHRRLDRETKDLSDRKLFEQVIKNPLFSQCKRIFLYVSVGYEIDTRRLIEACQKAGKEIALPRCYSKGIMEFYLFDGTLQEGKHGIPEPCGDVVMIAEPEDLMIVPGLAFTAECYRMGQGGGYYDRYLAKHPCITMGLCRDEFLKEELPLEWNDLPVSYVITETSVFENKNGAS